MKRELVLSQNSIKTLSECTYKFKIKYVDGFFWDDFSKENRSYNEGLKLGVDYHMRIRRFFQGVGYDEEIMKTKLSLIKSSYLENGYEFYNEFRINSFYKGRYFMADIDMLAIGEKDGIIYADIWDWKTDLVMPSQQKLESRMQTKIYLILVYENLKARYPNFDARNLRMKYYYPRIDSYSKDIKFSNAQYLSTKKMIDSYLIDINSIVLGSASSYRIENGACRFCEYRKFCGLCGGYDIG